MILINLKEFYPDVYVNDLYVIVEDGIYKILTKEITTNNSSVISINELADDDPVIVCKNEYECEYIKNLLLMKIKELPLKQMNRIYEVYYLNLTKSEIARIEGCTEGAIRKSIKRGLRQLKRKIKNQI